MDAGRNEFTFFWFIENYSYCWHENGEELISPTFATDGLKKTAWNLWLHPRGNRDASKGHISLFLGRSAEDVGPENISLKFELSFLAADGSPLRSVEGDRVFEKGVGYGLHSFLKMDEILLKRKADYLRQDILTVRCKIWKGEGNVVHNIGQCSARTRIKVEQFSFLHAVERFSTLRPNVKQKLMIRSHSGEQSFISSSLYFTEGLCCKEKIMVEIVPSKTNQTLCKCELYLFDGSGNKIECGKADNRYDNERKSINTSPLSLTREAVLNGKGEYLPDDKFSLLCKCTFSAGIEFQTIEETVHEMPLAVEQKSNDVPRKNACKSAEKLSAYPSVSEDMKALYINKTLTDVELKTETKSFPAHKIVLCARSPVFKAMLTNEMKEKNTDCIQVDDLGDDVLQQLLHFLYSDTVENLQWGMATQLYYAADKYQIGKLKEVCSSFLVENLILTNAGELLLLADNHSDGDLKEVVENFILEHEEQVFGLDEWEMLMETNPLLVMKAMHLKYKRKKNEVN